MLMRYGAATDFQGNALDDESQPELADSVRKTGQHTHEELSNSVGVKEYQPRAESEQSITGPIKDELKDTIVENDPFEPTFKAVGSSAAGAGALVGAATGSDGENPPLQDTGIDAVGAQGKAISSLGGGVEGVSSSSLLDTPLLPFYAEHDSAALLKTSLTHSSVMKPIASSVGEQRRRVGREVIVHVWSI